VNSGSSGKTDGRPYSEDVWALNPLNARNNINGMKKVPIFDYMSQRHPDLFHWQCAHVRKIVEETNRYDNLFYEICNEPGGSAGAETPPVAEVNDWQRAIAKVIRETETALDQAGVAEPICGQLRFDFPSGEYQALFFSPVTGMYSPAIPLRGGQNLSATLPPFRNDIVLRITRV
jgi:hypothetical protein